MLSDLCNVSKFAVLKNYPEEIKDFPITPFLEEICQTLKNSKSRFLVLTAETAAGKSTAVPLALLKNFSGKILMLEPRRIAAAAISDRIANLLNEKSGETVGYRLHLETKVSSKTRLEIITEAILTRMLQTDPSLSEGKNGKVSVVVLDEFHERSIHSDLALAFLKEAMALRDDLFVIVMSATLDAKKLSEYLGSKEGAAPVMKIPGRSFPVDVEYSGNEELPNVIMNVIEKKRIFSGSILVFLPGLKEIQFAKNKLEEKFRKENICAEILILHSSINFEEQKKVLTPQTDYKNNFAKNKMPRIILSSSIAETSITIPDVKVVIDSGFSRLSKINLNVGIEHLVTERESDFSAEQRKGRAGRTSNGLCIRMWNKNDAHISVTPPEILRSDLCSLVLECALWGCKDVKKISWLDSPTDASWNAAKAILVLMNCLTENGEITNLGKTVLTLGLSPRLSCSAIFGGAKNILKYTNYADSYPAIQKKFCDDVNFRLSKIDVEYFMNSLTEIDKKNILQFSLLAGFPDRIARHKENGLYELPSGRIASLPKTEIEKYSCFPEWIVIIDADSGESLCRIYSYEALNTDFATDYVFRHAKTNTVSAFEKDTLRLRKTEIFSYGELCLSTRRLDVTFGDFADALCTAVKNYGIEILPISKKTHDFLLRSKFYIQRNGQAAGFTKKMMGSAIAEAKDVESANTDANAMETATTDAKDVVSFEKMLLQNVDDWLKPFITATLVNEQNVYDALYYFLDGGDVDCKVPTRINLQNGKSVKITYDETNEIMPVLEIIIQQIFGCFTTPKILGVPVLLKLLSPARRPLQITKDLENFWISTWPEICKEMKGRYPKHNWDYRVLEK